MAQSRATRSNTVLVGNGLSYGSPRISTARAGLVVASSTTSSTQRLRESLADLKVQRMELATNYRSDALPMQQIELKIDRLEQLLRKEAPKASAIARRADGERFQVVLADLRLQRTYLSARYHSGADPVVALQRQIDALEKMMKDEGLSESPSEISGEANAERLRIVLTDLKLKRAGMAKKYRPQSDPMLDINAQVDRMERKIAAVESIHGTSAAAKASDKILARLNDMLFDLKIEQVDMSLRYTATSDPMVELQRRINNIEEMIEEELAPRGAQYGRRSYPVADASHGF